MNEEFNALVREIENSRRAMRETGEVLKTEANPVNRVRRTWSAHKGLIIAGGAAVAALAAVLVFRKRQPVVPPGYVVVTPATAPRNRWWGVAKFAALAARPALTAFLKSRGLHWLLMLGLFGPILSGCAPFEMRVREIPRSAVPGEAARVESLDARLGR